MEERKNIELYSKAMNVGLLNTSQMLLPFTCLTELLRIGAENIILLYSSNVQSLVYTSQSLLELKAYNEGHVTVYEKLPIYIPVSTPCNVIFTNLSIDIFKLYMHSRGSHLCPTT